LITSPLAVARGEWALKTFGWLAGVAVDPVQQVAYCSDSRLGEVYKLDIKQEKSSFVSLVKMNNVVKTNDVGTLGPVLLDSKRHRLLVADIEKGSIYSVDLVDKHVDTVLTNSSMREPSALALDAANDRLYIADSVQRKVWVVSLMDSKLRIQPFGEAVHFSQPVGLALGSDGSLWVADHWTHQLSQFNADGKLLRRVSM
jgi:sugar lactone lactonase YvrE